MGLRQSLRQGMRRRGFDLTRWPRQGTLERALRDVLKARAIDTILDVGAHVGAYGRLLRSLGFKGRIDSFEPDPATFQVLTREAMDPSWRCYATALGAVAGVEALTRYENTQLSSLHAPTPWAAQEWGLASGRRFDVPVSTVDAFIDEQGLDPGATLLKIDTQGHDSAVLEGARSSLPHLAALQIEMPMVALYERVPAFTDLLEGILASGLLLVGLFPVQRDPAEHLVPVEYDGLFVRSDLPANRRSAPPDEHRP